MKKILFICCFAMIALFAADSFAGPVRIAVAPFTVNSESGLDFLTTGIIDLFSSRLAVDNKVTILDKVKTMDAFKDSATITEKAALDKLKGLNADYLLFGSINESAKGITIDSFLVSADPDAKAGTLPFSEKSSQYESADVILLLVNRISVSIKRDVFKLNIPDENQKKPVNKSRDIYAHPNKLIEDL